MERTVLGFPNKGNRIGDGFSQVVPCLIPCISRQQEKCYFRVKPPRPTNVAVGQNQWYHFVGAPPILVYFSGDWDVHWILTHGHVGFQTEEENQQDSQRKKKPKKKREKKAKTARKKNTLVSQQGNCQKRAAQDGQILAISFSHGLADLEGMGPAGKCSTKWVGETKRGGWEGGFPCGFLKGNEKGNRTKRGCPRKARKRPA